MRRRAESKKCLGLTSLDTTLAVVDLFFAMSKVVRGECTFGTLSAFFLKPGEDRKRRTRNGNQMVSVNQFLHLSLLPTS